MKTFFKLIWYYIETKYIKLLCIFGKKLDASIIPTGIYCYCVDKERNITHPCTDGGYWIKTCKYYRSTPKTGGIACTYVGYYGFDFCLYDQCKICGINNEIEERDIL